MRDMVRGFAGKRLRYHDLITEGAENPHYRRAT